MYIHISYISCFPPCGEWAGPNTDSLTSIRYGLVVRIPGSHPGGPGSIPGVGNLLAAVLKHFMEPNR